MRSIVRISNHILSGASSTQVHTLVSYAVPSPFILNVNGYNRAQYAYKTEKGSNCCGFQPTLTYMMSSQQVDKNMLHDFRNM